MHEVVLVEMNYKGYYERFALTVEEFKERFPETVKVFGEPTAVANSDTIKPLVHIWYKLDEISGSFWDSFFTRMDLGLPDSDVESGNLAYIDLDECESLRPLVQEFVKEETERGN